MRSGVQPGAMTIVDADDIDAVSIVVANHLHREIADALLASGKHVLCEKPLASSVEDAEAMVQAADASGHVAACGFSYRRSRPLPPSVSRSRPEHSARSCTSAAGIGATTPPTRTRRQAGATRVHSVRGRSPISAVIFST
jgi:hypothetical protein